MTAALALMHGAHGYPALQAAALRLVLAPPLLQRVAAPPPDTVRAPGSLPVLRPVIVSQGGRQTPVAQGKEVLRCMLLRHSRSHTNW